MATPDIDHSFLFAFLYQLLVTQSLGSQTSVFDGFINFVRIFLCKSYVVDKETTASVCMFAAVLSSGRDVAVLTLV